MNKNCTYLLLPTDKESNLLIVTTDNMAYRGRIMGALELHDSPFKESENFKPHHIYILSDDAIQEEQWMIDGTGKLRQSQRDLSQEEVKESMCRKVIATSNPELHWKSIKDGGTCKTFDIPIISQSDIEYIISLYDGKDKEVDVEKLSEKSYKNELRYKKMNSRYPYKIGYGNGYNQCLQDNDDKKFTLEDMINCYNQAKFDGNAMAIILHKEYKTYKSFEEYIKSFTKEQPKSNIVMVEYENDYDGYSGNQRFPNQKPKLKDGNIVIVK